MSQQKVSTKLPKLKLMYFNVKGGAEVSRLCLAACGIEYEDFRFPEGKWQSDFKKEMPLKAAPVLEVDGKKFCQSNAIARYICRLTNEHEITNEDGPVRLFGQTDLDELKIDEIFESVGEVTLKGYESLFFEKDEKKKAEKTKEYHDNDLPKFLNYFVKQIEGEDKKGDGNNFLVGKRLTLADVSLFNFLDAYEKFSGVKLENVKKEYAKLKTFYDHVAKQKRIKAWIDNRPKTDY